MKVVLISGKAGHGKDTFAAFLKTALAKERGSRVLITHYADLLKFICEHYFDWNGRKDEYGRHLLQYVGTDIIRKENPNLWVDFVITMLNYFQDNWDYVLIPDCRFPNEIERIKEVGFDAVHIRVVRPNYKGTVTTEQQSHPSETALDNYPADFIINNDALEHLADEIDYLLKKGDIL